MIKEALQYLISLGNTEVTEVNGQQYSTQPLHLVEEARAKAIVVNSLSGLVDYLKSEFDGSGQRLIHIASPTEVNVYSHLNNDMARNTFMQAKAMIPQFRFGSWHSPEEFIIALQSVFVSNEDRATMLQIVGNIKDETVTSLGDDGVSQQVRAKTGVATVADVKVPNPVYLRPYRTFVEVAQPESAFVFRMRSGPECALFEADGGAWKVEAMDTVRNYLAENLQGQINANKVVLLA